ncbi:protein of unknown function [Tenacibaculum sp. MAR_2009_124]|uniref:DUF4270 family protein n=1 Tax=Tenacibaculum sp. MAR_2009_124 TaxID=1250059 RepID=UPI000898A28D|nr:DUF4270 family protein [Tenacibaculum sp. MAR_2009_124]SEC32944.1 protein of unknown function [Tenacibaculum sp. MAR_2009_124]
MIRKIGILGVGLFCLVSILSCEEDFNDIGSNVVKNTKFDTNEVELEIEITPIDLESVRADNVSLGNGISEYWLGVYNSGNYKTLESSFLSQLGLATNLRTVDVEAASDDYPIDSIYSLDDVILKLPYTSTRNGNHDDGSPKFILDSLLGNPDIATNIKVYRNGTYLNLLDPSNPSESNSYMSNETYIEEELLNNDASFSFKPVDTDTMYTITRTRTTDFTSNATETFDTEEKLSTTGPFITIPLDKNRMKELFWDKFGDSEFTSTQEFANYFRGVYVKAEGTDGSLLPFNLSSSNPAAAVEFHYTISRFEKEEGNDNLVYKDTIASKYSFPLNGIRNASYKMTPASNAIPNDNFVIQGTAGTMAQVKVLGVNLAKIRQNDPNNAILKYEEFDNNPQDDYLSLEELATVRDTANDSFGLLISDAALTFYINQAINTDKDIVPQRLFIYTNEDDDSGNSLPKHVIDAYSESQFFNGNLVSTDDDQPEKYTIRITDYISNLLDRSSTNFAPLILKAYNNPTDNPFLTGALNTNVFTYNWNPRGVTLLNQNESTHGAKKAVLKLTYSEKR